MKSYLALAAYAAGWIVLGYCIWDLPTPAVAVIVAAVIAISECSRAIEGFNRDGH